MGNLFTSGLILSLLFSLASVEGIGGKGFERLGAALCFLV
jgi:hypothetical protein